MVTVSQNQSKATGGGKMTCNKKSCGNCTFNRFDGDEYICNNEESVNYEMYTDDDTVCDEWTQKGGDQ